MVRPGSASPSRPASGFSVAFGVPLALLWAVHAAAPRLPGSRVLLLPFLLVMAAGLLVWRRSRTDRVPQSNRAGITVGLSLWFIAATLSSILNYRTEEVILTYVVVFLAGAAIYVAVSGFPFTSDDLELAVFGLALGSLVPLIAGLVAFGTEWGRPDVTTTISAWQNLARMVTYSDATFGNRGNTAGFLLIVTPMFLATLIDRRRRLPLRACCAATLVVIALNLLILQVRAAFVVMAAAVVAVLIFRFGARRLPWLLGAAVLGGVVLLNSEAGGVMAERLLPAITVDADGDESVQGRTDAIREGVSIASQNWLLGIGPGAGLTAHSRSSAHQFQVQQAMETGVLGLIGSIVLSIGVWVALFRTMARGSGEAVNDARFLLLIGPAAFVTYAVIANAALNNVSLNTWTVLIASMLGLAPCFDGEPLRAPGRSVSWPQHSRARARAQPSAAAAAIQCE